MSEVTLVVNNREFGGWEQIQINLGIKQIAGDFQLIVSERWPGSWDAQRIRDGDPCTVKIDGETIITGYVDEIQPRYDAGAHTIMVSGRDRAGDLVDCSAIYQSGSWHGVTLLQIASDLCQPFGVKVTANGDVGQPFREFSVQEGETVFEAISRAAGMRGLLSISDGSGNLILTRAGTTSMASVLTRPGNLLAGSGMYSSRDRYSEYVTKGQRRGTDEDVGAPELLSSASGRVTDSGVKRYRPLIVLAEDQGDGISFEQRAAWERNVRMGNSIVARVTVRGWRTEGDSGELWRINRLVKITDDWLWLNDTMLISGVSFSRGNDGTFTDMELTHPAAFELLAEPEQKAAVEKVGIEAKR